MPQWLSTIDTIFLVAEIHRARHNYLMSEAVCFLRPSLSLLFIISSQALSEVPILDSIAGGGNVIDLWVNELVELLYFAASASSLKVGGESSVEQMHHK